MKERNPSLNAWTLLAGAGAFVLYVLTLAPGFMPGESAFAVTQSLSDSLFPTFGHALWHSLVGALDALPFGGLYVKTGLFSAFTGAVVVMGILWFVCRIPLGKTPEEMRTPVSLPVRRAVAVGVAALVALFSPPLWFAATRPFPQMFGLACLLLIGVWTVATFRKRSPGMLQAAAVMWGWIGTEYATAWFFAPAFLAAVLYTGFDIRGRFRWGRNFKLAGWFLLGMAAGYLFVSLKVLFHAHAGQQGMHHLGDALLNTLRVQSSLLRQAAPARGGLLVFFLFGGPFLLVVMPKESRNMDARFGSMMLHAVCGIINGVMLFHPAISPWGMYELGQLRSFMVVPSAMLAVSSGYLAAYWLAVIQSPDSFWPEFLRIPRHGLRLLTAPALVVLFAVSTLLNILNLRDPELEAVNRHARAMAASLADADLYAGESGFNNLLRLELRRRGAHTRVIDLNPRLWSRAAYRNIVAEGFPDEPRLATLAGVGAGPLLIGLAAGEGGVERRFVLGDHPDFIYRAGKTPVPVPYGYVPRADPAAPGLRESARELRALWRNMDPSRLWDETDGNRRDRRGAALLAKFYASESRRANNLGVLLERRDLSDGALESYRLARRLMPSNLSALLNLSWHADDLPEPEREGIRTELADLLENIGESRFQQWRLAEAYGYISHPRAYVDRGMAWVVSGMPDMAVRDYQEALRRAPGAASLRLRLAFAHFSGRDLDAAEEEFAAVLEHRPESASALIGLARIYGLRGMTGEAEAYLSRARDAGVNQEVLYAEEVRLAAIAGDLDKAARLADQWIEERPNRLAPVLDRILIALQREEAEKADRLVETALGMSRPTPEERLRLARLLFLMGRTEQARSSLRSPRQSGAVGRQGLELELDMALRERDLEESQRIAGELLSIDPRHARANFVLGSIRLHQGRLTEAEAAYRASLRRETTPEVLNDLANLLLETRRPDEALETARRAVELKPGSPVALDTLAETLLELGRVDEAYGTILKALAAAPEVPVFQLTLARIHRAADRVERAREVAEGVFARQDELSPDNRRELRDLIDVLED